MFRGILSWAEEGRKHDIPWCCGLRFGFGCVRPKFFPTFGLWRLWRLKQRLAILGFSPRVSFGYWDAQGYIPCEYHLLKWLLTGRRPNIMQDEHVPYINQVAAKAREVCEAKGWKRNWSNGGCYLHLEVSEFIEALRGKGDESPAEEAADVLFVLLSMLHAEDISPADVLDRLDRKCDELLAKERRCTCGYEDSKDPTMSHTWICNARQKRVLDEESRTIKGHLASKLAHLVADSAQAQQDAEIRRCLEELLTLAPEWHSKESP